MTFIARHVAGGSVRDPSDEELAAIIAELDTVADGEHPGISVEREDGWCLSAFANGGLVLEDLDDENAVPVRLVRVPRERLLAIIRTFVANGPAGISGAA